MSAVRTFKLRTTGTETQEQIALFQWADLTKHRVPQLELMYAVPNGGLRNKAVAGQLKASGVKPGVPDICLPVARGIWHSLYVEMKVGRNKQTADQLEYAAQLLKERNLVVVCGDGWKPASEEILAYLDGAL